MRYPKKRARPALRRRHVAAALLPRPRDGAALLVRGTASLLGGLWQFPAAEAGSPDAAAARLRETLGALGLELAPGPPFASTRHTMVHRRLAILVYRARIESPKFEIPSPKSARWFTPARLETAAIPTLTRRIALAAGVLTEP